MLDALGTPGTQAGSLFLLLAAPRWLPDRDVSTVNPQQLGTKCALDIEKRLDLTF